MSAPTLLRAELERLVERYREADDALRRAETVPDRAAAEWARIEAMGELTALGKDVADLFLLLLRQAVRHRPEAVAGYLVKLLRPVLDELGDAVARLERGGRR